MQTTNRVPTATFTRPQVAAVPAVRVLLAGAVVGATDALFAFVLQLAYTGGIAPARIFQGIASGVLGAGAVEGGAGTTALGVALHFGFALTWVLTYATAYRFSRHLRDLARGPLGVIALALVYGALVWTVMNYVAKPIGGISPTPAASMFFLIMTLGHGVVVGLPTVLLVRAAHGDG